MYKRNNMRPVSGSSIFIRAKDSTSTKCYFFDTKDITELELNFEEKDYYYITSIDAIKNGYYIITNGRKMDVFYKGNIPYFSFLMDKKNKGDDTIELIVEDINGDNISLTYNNIINNIYICNSSTIDNIGFILHNGFVKAPFNKNNSKQSDSIDFVSKIEHTTKANTTINSNISTKKEKTTLTSNTISSNIRSTNISSNL